MPLICKPLAQGQTVPEMLKEMLSFMEDNRPHVFHSPKQVCLTHLHWMCLITRGQEVHRQEIHQDVHLPLIGCRLEVHQDVCLHVIGPDGKY